MNKSGKTQEIAHRILEHLMDRPEVPVTLDGIVDWWLLQQNVIQRNVTLIGGNAVEEPIQKKALPQRQCSNKAKYVSAQSPKCSVISSLKNRRKIVSSLWNVESGRPKCFGQLL